MSKVKRGKKCKVKEEENFEPPKFNEVPMKSKLEALYNKYRATFGDKKYKAGKSHIEVYENRYCEKDRYKKLNASNIFCTTSDQATALEIEFSLKKILAENGRCANSTNDSLIFMPTSSDVENLVYLAELHDNLVLCPMRGCLLVSRMEQMSEHLEKHKFLKDVDIMRAEAKKLGYKGDIDIETKAVPFHLKSWNTKKCQFCNLDMRKLSHGVQVRHRFSCLKNPLAPFVCTHPGCGIRVTSSRNYLTHMQSHKNKAYMETRNTDFKCSYCPKTFIYDRNLKRHQLTCFKNPKRDKNLLLCSICGKKYTRRELLAKHLCIPQKEE